MFKIRVKETIDNFFLQDKAHGLVPEGRLSCQAHRKTGRRIIAVLVMIMLLASVAGLFAACGQKDKAITSLDQLKEPGTKIGVASETSEFHIVEKDFPEAEIVYFKDELSAYTSVAQGRIDAFFFNKLSMQIAIDNGFSGVRLLDEAVGEPNIGAAAISPHTKIPDLKDKINDFLKDITDDGTIDDIRIRWLEKHEQTMPDIPEAEDPKYHLVVGTSGCSNMFTFYADGELVGYDIELAKRFASWLGASLEFKIYDYEGIVAAAQGGDVDCIFANLFVTPERKQAIEFSDPTYIGEIGVMVKDPDSKAAEQQQNGSSESLSSGSGGFLAGLKDSFNKTFIREGRWKLFVKGIGTTLLITILSILLGTLTGFVVFMICRKGNRAANAVTRFCIWLIEGMPVVVLLMVLYYIVFGRAQISGVTVSVIAFTLIFAAAVFSMLKAGVAAVGTGQMEAAYSLGYSDRKAFFKIILPQTLPHVAPAFKSQVKALIKATAVVGYIAVQDLTKMGDVVRSRTYEAFFPLVAVAVIYFILAALLTFVVNRIELRTVPQRKPKEDKKKEGNQA